MSGALRVALKACTTGDWDIPTSRGGHMRQAFWKSLFTGAFAAMLLAAFEAGAAGMPVTFQLNWMAGGPNAGFAAALAEGYYAAEGLDVTLVQGNGSGNTA